MNLVQNIWIFDWKLLKFSIRCLKFFGQCNTHTHTLFTFHTAPAIVSSVIFSPFEVRFFYGFICNIHESNRSAIFSNKILQDSIKWSLAIGIASVASIPFIVFIGFCYTVSLFEMQHFRSHGIFPKKSQLIHTDWWHFGFFFSLLFKPNTLNVIQFAIYHLKWSKFALIFPTSFGPIVYFIRTDHCGYVWVRTYYAVFRHKLFHCATENFVCWHLSEMQTNLNDFDSENSWYFCRFPYIYSTFFCFFSHPV